MNGRREIVAQLIAEGKSPGEVANQVGYAGADSVQQALRSVEVQERVKFNRAEMFDAAKIDRVDLLKDLYQRCTVDQGEIFKILRGEHGTFLAIENLEKLEPYQSRLIANVKVEGMAITDIKFHSQDTALKILAKAAGFEDGAVQGMMGEEGGPFRGLIIIPPKEVIDIPSSGEGPPGKPDLACE